MRPLECTELTPLSTGLNDAQAAVAVPNVIVDNTQKSLGQMIVEQVFSYFNLINFVLAAIVLFTGSWRNLLFMIVVIANTATALYQEIHARRILNKLRWVHRQRYEVLRNGKWQTMDAQAIVHGDLIRLTNGMQAPCDGIVREGMCQVNESLLTGEADPVDRDLGQSVYGGCYLVSGQCVIQAAAVGNAQYMASILKDAHRQKQYPSQLRDSLNAIIRFSSWMIFPAGLLLFAKQFFFSHLPLNDALLATVASMVGMIPEGLVILTSIALMGAAIKMARQAVLIQELYCTENLARVDVLCLDKTGTITSGRMNVVEVSPQPGFTSEEVRQMLADLYGALEDDNLTAQAIRQSIADLKPQRKADRLFPFSSSAKCSGAVFDNETLMAGAYSFMVEPQNPQVEHQIEQWAQTGLRVIALAKAPHLDKLKKGDWTICGFVLIEDELRPDARQILDYFQEQEVQTKVISGDMTETVAAIARKAGIEGEAFDMSQVPMDQIGEVVEKGRIFGRVSPDQKKEMVRALQSQGHVVAMTGDGVNDVMALKQADCSIAMGSGAQAAMTVASMVLLQDQFSALPAIVLEGRRVINNIERTASLFLVKTLFSFFLAVLTVLWMSTYPFIPIQLTLVSSLGTGIPAFILTFENSIYRPRGSFMVRVLDKALPGALALCAGISVCYALMRYAHMGISIEDFQTMCTGLAAFNAICVLYTICRPLSLMRAIVLIISSLGLAAAIAFLPNVFMLTRLGWVEFGLLLLCLCLQTMVFIMLRSFHWRHWLAGLSLTREQKKQSDQAV